MRRQPVVEAAFITQLSDISDIFRREVQFGAALCQARHPRNELTTLHRFAACRMRVFTRWDQHAPTDWKGAILSKESVHRAATDDVDNGALRAPWGYIVSSIGLVVLAVCPAVICAYLAQTSAHWGLFERSGSIVTIIGLLLASRHYFSYSIPDLVAARTNKGAGFKAGRVLSDALAARRGLTLSAFGTLIWGWGIFLRWWSFAVLALWMAFVIYRIFCDPVLQRRRDDVLPLD
jgi:hypothetical protein